jgi:hypothetical protein
MYTRALPSERVFAVTKEMAVPLNLTLSAPPAEFVYLQLPPDRDAAPDLREGPAELDRDRAGGRVHERGAPVWSRRQALPTA